MCAVRNGGKDLNPIIANHNKEKPTAAIIVPRLTYEGMKCPKALLTNTTGLSKGQKDIRKSVPAPMTWTVLTKSPYLGNNGNTLETCRRSFFTPHQGTSLDTVKDTNNSGGPNKSEVETNIQKRKPNRGLHLHKIKYNDDSPSPNCVMPRVYLKYNERLVLFANSLRKTSISDHVDENSAKILKNVGGKRLSLIHI